MPSRVRPLAAALCLHALACSGESTSGGPALPRDSGSPSASGDSGMVAEPTGPPGPICDGADLFANACSGVSCHFSGPGSAQGLDLLSPGVPDRLVGFTSTCEGRLYIDPAAPERSFLLSKLTEDPPPCGGSRMPFNGQLTDAQLECVRVWVLGFSE